MIRMGIFGEHLENDAEPLKALLEKKFQKDSVLFFPINAGNGDQLTLTKAVEKKVNAEIANKKLDYIICMRDLDGLPSEIKKIEDRQAWFQKIKVNKPSLFFLVIYELEAIILADIEAFNKKYKVQIAHMGNPLWKENPKEFLREKTTKSQRQYNVNHALEIFKDLNFEKVYANHTGPISFKTFVDALDAIINP
ncbi:MAG: DUF4276 family protein [Saprospiraceae bacterium]